VNNNFVFRCLYVSKLTGSGDLTKHLNFSSHRLRLKNNCSFYVIMFSEGDI
jgi:hypothetical protein